MNSSISTYSTITFAAPTIGAVSQSSFTGKETDCETGYSYFGARYYDPTLLTSWTAVDPMSDDYPNMSPYHYCHWNPLVLKDPNGMWDVKISASSNRAKNPYAILTVHDRHGKEVYRTVVKVTGVKGHSRHVTGSDTPQGKYQILYWDRKNGTKKERESYGPNHRLALSTGEALDGQSVYEGGTRDQIMLHGGRQEGKYSNDENLKDTYGCIRINDNDIEEIKSITDNLESMDKFEFRGYLVVEDDLATPVDYSTNAVVRHRAGIGQPCTPPVESTLQGYNPNIVRENE